MINCIPALYFYNIYIWLFQIIGCLKCPDLHWGGASRDSNCLLIRVTIECQRSPVLHSGQPIIHHERSRQSRFSTGPFCCIQSSARIFYYRRPNLLLQNWIYNLKRACRVFYLAHSLRTSMDCYQGTDMSTNDPRRPPSRGSEHLESAQP